MSSMKSVRSAEGSVALVVSLVITVLLLLGAAGFGYWAYGSRQDYKNNVDQKISVAVADAKQQTSIAKDKQFAEEEKNPLRTYIGPSDFGSVHVAYPKTWSAYVISHSDSAPYLDGYFNPSTVPDVNDDQSAFALRIRVSGDSYSSIMENYQGNVEAHLTKVKPYTLPNMPKVVGSKVTGQLANNKQGTLIVLPLRANALEIWTETSEGLKDFNKYIVPNLTFSP